MSLWSVFLLAVALAMDCFTISVVSGVISRRNHWRPVFRMAFFFGLFQALMPLLGWLAMHFFEEALEAWDHWIAFGMLAAIGLKMIKDAFGDGEESHFDPESLKAQLALAVATSIDALAVGITFSCTGYNTVASLLLPMLVIGLVSFAFSLAGHVLGVRFGEVVARRWKPELVGGIILIAIGVKILIEHLGA